MKDGTIRGRETRQVITDLMNFHKVPRSVWSITPRGKLTILVGSRAVEFDCPSGLSFYALKALCEKVEVALREREDAKRHAQQLDLEAAIAQSASA